MLKTLLNASKQFAGVARCTSACFSSLPSKIPSPGRISVLGQLPPSRTSLRVPKIPVLNDPPPVIQSLIIEHPVHRSEVTTPSIAPSIQDPSKIIEKRAERLIVIRKRKMRRHKLKKLRKKMKFVYAKIRQRREIAKEKLFQKEILSQLKTAEKFDARAYVAEKLKKVNEVPTPKLWRGKKLPEFVILDLMKKQEEKKRKIANDKERWKTMKVLVSEYKV